MIFKEQIEGRKVIALARQSTIDKQKDSIPSQKSTIETFCKDNNLILEDVPGTDGGIYEHKGSALDERTDLKRIIEDYENGLFDADFIVFRDDSRFGRSSEIDMGDILKPFKEKGIRIIFCKFGCIAYDLRDATDAKILSSQIAAGYAYVEAIANNVVTSKYTRCQTMKEPPTECYGVSVHRDEEDKDRWEVVADKEKLGLVKQLGKMFIDGVSKFKICQFANEAGFKSLRGNKLASGSLDRMLSNPLYVGDYVKLKTKAGKLRTSSKGGIPVSYTRNEKIVDRKTKKGKNFVEKREEPLVIHKDVDFLIDAGVKIFNREEHNQILYRLQSSKFGNDERKTKRKWGLTGKVFCECGVRMRGVKMANTGVPVYECDRNKGGCKNRKKISEIDISKAIMESYYRTILFSTDSYVDGILKLRKEMRLSTDIRIKIRELENLKANIAELGAKVSTEIMAKWLSDQEKIEKEISEGKKNGEFDIKRFSQDDLTIESELISAAKEFGEETLTEDFSSRMFSLCEKVSVMRDKMLADEAFTIGPELAERILDSVVVVFDEKAVKRRRGSNTKRRHYEATEISTHFSGVTPSQTNRFYLAELEDMRLEMCNEQR